MKALLINYNYRPDWLLASDLDYLLYDRSDDGINHLDGFPKERIVKTTNVGNVDYDKLSFLVDFYDTLPDVFLWGKSNLEKYVSPEQIANLVNFTEFTPLLKQDHKTYSNYLGPVCFYQSGMYYEINNSWYVPELSWKYFNNYTDFSKEFNLPNPKYLPFAPGGNYILTREAVHRYGRDYYDRMRQILPYAQLPAEAHMCERSYYNLWK